jgi:hypothetical protein
MASQAGFIGRIGDVVHYQMGDKFYSRSMPVKYKQTNATKAKASQFGKASTTGKIIRKELSSVIVNRTDKKMQIQLVKQIVDWFQLLRNKPPSKSKQPENLIGFHFSTETVRLMNRWTVNIQITIPKPGVVQIKIPAFVPVDQLKAPAGTVDVICKIATVVIDMENTTKVDKATNKISFLYNNDEVSEQTIVQNLKQADKNLIITGLSLEYYTSDDDHILPPENQHHMPAEIIHAVYS